MEDARLVSVVVPIYCEESLIGVLYQRLDAALTVLPHGYEHEILFVDDGSHDGSLAELIALRDGDARVKVLSLSRNFGHQAAITAGMDAAAGHAVVIIDGDLQDPPEVILEMVDAWKQGFEVVYGQRIARVGESRFKRATAKAFYRLISSLSDTPLPLDAGDFRLMDRVVVDAFLQMPEEGRYIRGMITWLGFRQYALPYQRDARYAGETKYTLRKMVKLAIDGVTSFSSKPLSISMGFGMLVTAFSFAYLVWIVASRLMHPEVAVPGYASLLVAVLFLGGVQLMSVGVLGMYLARVFYETKRRPLYVVARRYGFDEAEDQRGTL